MRSFAGAQHRRSRTGRTEPADLDGRVSTPPSDAQIVQELEAVAARLAAMAYGPPNPELVAAELAEIRAELRRLADCNAQVRARLGSVLEIDPDGR